MAFVIDSAEKRKTNTLLGALIKQKDFNKTSDRVTKVLVKQKLVQREYC